ncbi:hypothetical protein LUZ63_013586 [Rhynchospora breviuscula]|uniref:MRN complex-interacting protein N-terminal domain-containing protein n=1 Tax=Rhynchospora breviuscula TaxID=2022672 RepID=A0A9Q0C8U6_9POAL|nr:hypothetical protein LUZ63_013586 [Rhynchospora breviuscula]
MPTVFVALQCAQCSTMQVKQQKKSSNKWACVVCNLRQSICRVYARGPMAHDLRKFVQEFNMSRMEIGQSDSTDLSPSPSELPIEACQSKKRMDWSEYLDSVEETEAGENEESELDMKIVTEMPQQKPKVTSSRYQQKNYEYKLFHKNAPKRKRDQEGFDSQYSSCSKGGKEANTCKLSNQQSRWSNYLDDENEEETRDETVRGGSYSFMPSNAIQKLETEHLVEDEVHPDFI